MPKIDPITGERIPDGPQIDPATGERISASADSAAPYTIHQTVYDNSGTNTGGIAGTNNTLADPRLLKTAGDRVFGAHPLTDTIGTAATHLGNLVAGPYHAFVDGPQNPQEAQEKGTSATSGPMNVLGQLGLGTGRMFVDPTRNAWHEAVKQAKIDNANHTQRYSEYDDQGNYTPTVPSSLLDAIPIAGPIARSIENDANKHGAVPALLGGGIDLGAAELGSKLLSPGNTLRAPFAAGLDEPMIGTEMTPRQRYHAAQRTGVQLDLADATNADSLKTIKAATQDAPGASGVYEKAKGARLSNLDDYANSTRQGMSGLDSQETGGLMQRDLLGNQKAILDSARQGYSNVRGQYGDTPLGVDGSQKLFGVADDIINENARVAKQMPSLVPKQTAAIVGDASNYGKPTPPTIGEVASGYDSPTIGDTITQRSRLYDAYKNNQDMVKTAADADLQRLVGGADDAISGKLPPDGLQLWRDANEKFRDVKETYDDPSSPYYHAVRTQTPSTLAQGIGTTPESVAELSSRVSPEAMGGVQANVLDKLFGETPGGQARFGAFPQRLANMSAPYRDALFGDNVSKLKDISSTAQTLSKDLNPSGTAKLTQKTDLLRNPFAWPAVPFNYAAAKLMNSPGLANIIMRDVAPSALDKLPISPTYLPVLKPLLQKKTGTNN